MTLRQRLLEGHVIPAHPLALDRNRKLDESRQRGLTQYYARSGAGGIAVAVHTTQFAIREHALLEPVLRMAIEEWRPTGGIAIAGVCGKTQQAILDATLAQALGYDAGLLSLAAFRDDTEEAILEHARTIAKLIPVVGFYLQPAVGGRILSHNFWSRFVEIENVVAIKIAPFHRYQTIDVMRAVASSGRAGEIALYTGNDDNIINDLLTTYDFNGTPVRMVGGLLGQWAVWTRRAVEILEQIKQLKSKVPSEMLTLNAQLTDANAAIFDVANHFHGCIAGIHEVLRRQGLLDGIWCLDPNESLGPGQLAEMDRVLAAYPQLQD
ncbi:MAG: dihydrodipicolinate synthase family protein [Acidobacteria bacterium]|nr:dihydrodipicolinate synthase family protein [Acidobacteriota bacterium]